MTLALGSRVRLSYGDGRTHPVTVHGPEMTIVDLDGAGFVVAAFKDAAGTVTEIRMPAGALRAH